MPRGLAIGAAIGAVAGLLLGIVPPTAFPERSIVLALVGAPVGALLGGMFALLRARNASYRARAARARRMSLAEQVLPPTDAGSVWKPRRSRRGGRARGNSGRAPRGPQQRR